MKALENAEASYSSVLDSNERFEPRISNRQFSSKERKQRTEQYKELIQLYKKGLESIRTNESAKKAFLAMNRVFMEYYDNKSTDSAAQQRETPSWRLFQILFIVICMRSLVRGEDLDKVDVLHVATGGGKSEAYFGLIVFSLFFERLNGKESGVTALVKFPLRMLSIQQLERLSSIIIYAEKIRKTDGKFRGEEFSLGYYVGSSDDDFPATYKKQKSKLYHDKKFTSIIDPPPKSKIISSCPLCEGPDRGELVLKDDIEGKRLLHVCNKNLSHVFHIYFSDREIFRYRPSVIVSTVDKWASLASQRRARSILGGRGSMCPNNHGFIPCGETCENNKDEKEADYSCSEIGMDDITSDGPILSIQDELHLLKEGFGTIASHFEGLIEQLVMSNSNGRKLKHIAMSATLNGVSNQIKEIYNKGAVVIPGPSPEDMVYDTGLFFEKKDDYKRIIYGMKPNLRDSHYAALRTVLHYAEFIDNEQHRFLNDKLSYLKEYGYRDEEIALDEFRMHLTALTYHLKRQDAEDMYRFTDTVINDSLARNNHVRVNGTVLTGERGLDELKQTIDIVRDIAKSYDVGLQTKPEAVYYPIFSTSVISHGVDLEELNFMIFQGMPQATAEYIQALSRVGRKRRGMVIMWFHPNRIRDDSFFRNFSRYHESLDHEVKLVPVNRQSRLGMMQTINSIFCAGIIQHLSEQTGRPLIYKSDIDELSNEQIDELVRFIKSVYGEVAEINIPMEVEKL